MPTQRDDIDQLAAFRHDAKTPLHTILGFTDMLRGLDLDDEAATHVEHIRQAALDLAERIDALGTRP